ncbi:MAG: hypothetical protein Q4D11_05845 [Rhodospirillales bacterium]|nr:hypothetical protein [Rhodospirillales bacterium]
MNKRELEKLQKDYERTKFFSGCQKRMEKACQDYLLTQGYYVTHLRERKDVSIDDDIFDSISRDIDEYIKQIKFVKDGVKITNTRKEKMLSCVYAVENAIVREGNNPHNIKELANKLDKNFLIQVCLLLGILTLPIIPISAIFLAIFYFQYVKRKKIKEEIKVKSVRLLSKLPLI